MRHHDSKRKLGRERNARKALLKSLAGNLILRGRITTTEARAKELRPFVEKLVTEARNQTLASRRLVLARLGTEKYAKKLYNDVAPRYQGRQGGYTRIVKLSRRTSDASKMAVIEFV